MKPVLVLCLAFLCLSMVFAAPAPAPIVLPLVVSSSGLVTVPAALTASNSAAIAGSVLLGKAALIAAVAQ